MHLKDLHTIVDHFTLALVNVGIIFEILALVFKNEGMKRFSWNALRLGVIFAFISVLTGLITESSVFISPTVEPLSNYHKVLSYAAVGILAAAVMLRLASRERFEDIANGATVRGAYLALVLVTFFLIGVAGFLGTRMVYTYGVNVQPYEEMITTLPQTTLPQSTMPPTPSSSSPDATSPNGAVNKRSNPQTPVQSTDTLSH